MTARPVTLFEHGIAAFDRFAEALELE